jgi:hypothetical protein
VVGNINAFGVGTLININNLGPGNYIADNLNH